MDPKWFSSWVHRSVVLLKRGFGRQTSSRWRFSRKTDWIVQVIPQQAIKAIRVLSTRKIVTRRQKLGWHFFTTALGLYAGVLWSGGFQGFIIHEMVPTTTSPNYDGMPDGPALMPVFLGRRRANWPRAWGPSGKPRRVGPYRAWGLGLACVIGPLGPVQNKHTYGTGCYLLFAIKAPHPRR
jgi:hypothetical protein